MNERVEKILAFLAYLLVIVGALYILIVHRKNKLAVHHAKQALGIIIIAISVFIAWVVGGWIISWVPYIGFIFTVALFALVIVTYIVLCICYITGMVYALDVKMQPVPIVGNVADRLASMIVGTSS
jgi:uncharacterized membrane protein